MSLNNVAIIKNFYQHLQNGDKDLAFELIDDNAIWHSDNIDGPWSGTYQGKPAIRQHFQAMANAIHDVKKTVTDYLEKGDLVIELSLLSCVLNKTNERFETELVCLYRLSNGKIVSYTVFEDSYKLHRAYFPKARKIPDNTEIVVLTEENSPSNYLFPLLTREGYRLSVTFSPETAQQHINHSNHKVLLMATGHQANAAWQLAKNDKKLRGLLLLHPKKLNNFTQQTLNCPCLVIHNSSCTTVNEATLQSLQRPRPEIAQFVSDDLVDAFAIFERFIWVFATDEPTEKAEIIKRREIEAKFPAPFPGAAGLFNKENLVAGMVKLQDHPAYEHNNMDEVMYLVAGSALFQHGNEAAQRVEAGDLIYVASFEKHTWSEQSADFQMLFVQIPRRVNAVTPCRLGRGSH